MRLADVIAGYWLDKRSTFSTRTVEGHRSNLSDKLGLHTRVELVRYAKEHDLIE